MSIAVACGNAFLLKPAEKAPLTGTRLVEMFADAGLPPGVVGVVQGSKEVSERLIADPHVQAVSFVGTSAVAESVYRLAAAHGKRRSGPRRRQNRLLVMPDADLERILPDLIGSASSLPAGMPGRERARGDRRSSATGCRRRRLNPPGG